MGIFDFFKKKYKYKSNSNSMQNDLIQSQREFNHSQALFDEYSKKFKKAQEFEKLGEIDKALEIYMDVINNYNPEGNYYYERPAIMLEKNKDYKKALSVALLGKQNLINHSINNSGIDINYFDKRIFRLEDKIKNPPKINIENKLEKNKKEISVPKVHIPKKEISKNISSWTISVSFGKSTSSNYNKAVFLAKHSTNYYEDSSEKNIIHQATYTSEPSEYLSFIKLYELVGSWKSSFVFINGKFVDRKIVGKLNYCYGDKCRSGNDRFCYGASEYTINPFGCHRLQVSECNNPWWSFGIFDTNGIWHVDKNAILDRINHHYTPFKNCPSFSYEDVLERLEELPDTINPKIDKYWVRNGDSICPKNLGVVTHISINLNE